jgi:hypothetical protein
MNRKWPRILLSLTVLFMALTASRLAFAALISTEFVPEIDPTLAISGLVLLGTGLALVLEGRRHRK